MKQFMKVDGFQDKNRALSIGHIISSKMNYCLTQWIVGFFLIKSGHESKIHTVIIQDETNILSKISKM